MLGDSISGALSVSSIPDPQSGARSRARAVLRDLALFVCNLHSDDFFGASGGSDLLWPRSWRDGDRGLSDPIRFSGRGWQPWCFAATKPGYSTSPVGVFPGGYSNQFVTLTLANSQSAQFSPGTPMPQGSVAPPQQVPAPQSQARRARRKCFRGAAQGLFHCYWFTAPRRIRRSGRQGGLAVLGQSAQEQLPVQGYNPVAGAIEQQTQQMMLQNQQNEQLRMLQNQQNQLLMQRNQMLQDQQNQLLIQQRRQQQQPLPWIMPPTQVPPSPRDALVLASNR